MSDVKTVRYEKFCSILKAAGKEVIFTADGNMDVYLDDVIACGARGIISEPRQGSTYKGS